jgi:F0F1-type ATP synthase membrane subunit c/vacuolar-type H+-ATPase subunit K
MSRPVRTLAKVAVALALGVGLGLLASAWTQSGSVQSPADAASRPPAPGRMTPTDVAAFAKFPVYGLAGRFEVAGTY